MVGITDFTVPEWGEVGSVFCLPNYRSSYEEDFLVTPGAKHWEITIVILGLGFSFPSVLFQLL